MDWPNYFELIVSMRVAEIASADFSRHVQPLNGTAVNWSPPQSNAMEDTAGRAYHLNPSSSNQSNLSESRCTLRFHHKAVGTNVIFTSVASE